MPFNQQSIKSNHLSCVVVPQTIIIKGVAFAGDYDEVTSSNFLILQVLNQTITERNQYREEFNIYIYTRKTFRI